MWGRLRAGNTVYGILGLTACNTATSMPETVSDPEGGDPVAKKKAAKKKKK